MKERDRFDGIEVVTFLPASTIHSLAYGAIK